MKAKVELTTPSEIWIIDDIDLGKNDSGALKTTLLDIILKAEQCKHIGTKTINKYGNIEAPEEGQPIRRKFECDNCGCIFETTRYAENIDHFRRVQFWASLCPCCSGHANEYRPVKSKPPSKIKGLAQRFVGCFKGAVEPAPEEPLALKEPETVNNEIADEAIEKEKTRYKVDLTKPPLIKSEDRSRAEPQHVLLEK